MAVHILVVEDEKPIREMICFGLRRGGYEVSEAEDVAAARSCVANRRLGKLRRDQRRGILFRQCGATGTGRDNRVHSLGTGSDLRGGLAR